MGYDVTYHPIKEQEIHRWYFDRLSDVKDNDCSQAKAIVEQFELDDAFVQRYCEVLAHGTTCDSETDFNLGHGFNIAVVQGLFRGYHYTRGSAFSFLIEENSFYKKYTKSWKDIAPFPTLENAEGITENYSAGVYLPEQQVRKLLGDYHRDPTIRKELETFYSHDRIHVFMEALKDAEELACGLLEATDVIVPNLADLDNSECHSYMYNCYTDGISLYLKAAIRQMNKLSDE